MRAARLRPRRSLAGVVAVAASLAGSLVASGCATVHLAGGYDAYVDQHATTLQKGMDAFLTKMESLPTGDAGRSYAASKEFYMSYGVELRSLEVRVGASPKNEISMQQLRLMEGSLGELRQAHETQNELSNAALDQYRTLFNTSWRAILAWELAKKR